jgi:Mrp family chromosome partitioning ATPase
MIPADTLQATHPAAAPEKKLVALAAPESPAAEQYRVLYQRLARLGARRPLRVVAVTSASRGEGRTTTAANLALIAAQEGRTVVLVDGDLRRPSVASLFGLAPRAGIAEVLDGTAELSQAVVRVGALSVLCAGDVRDPAAAIRHPRTAALVDQLRAAYDLVVLDAPPALAFADGERLASAAEAPCCGSRRGDAAAGGAARLGVARRSRRGVVLNDVDPESVAHGAGCMAAPARPRRPSRDGAQGSAWSVLLPLPAEERGVATTPVVAREGGSGPAGAARAGCGWSGRRGGTWSGSSTIGSRRARRRTSSPRRRCS